MIPDEDDSIGYIKHGSSNIYYSDDINNGAELFPDLDQDRKYKFVFRSERTKSEIIQTSKKKDPEWWDIFEWFTGQDEWHEVTSTYSTFAVYIFHPVLGWRFIGEREAKTSEVKKQVNKDGSTYYHHADNPDNRSSSVRGEDDLLDALLNDVKEYKAKKKAKETDSSQLDSAVTTEEVLDVVKSDPAPFYFSVYAADLDEHDNIESYVLLPRTGFIGTGFHSGTTDVILNVNETYKVKDIKKSLVITGQFKDADGNILDDNQSVRVLEIKPEGQPSRVRYTDKNTGRRIFTEVLRYTRYTVLGLPIKLNSEKEN